MDNTLNDLAQGQLPNLAEHPTLAAWLVIALVGAVLLAWIFFPSDNDMDGWC